MRFTQNPGRIAGLLYVLASIVGIFGLLYVPSKLIVDGNAVETARNIAASETLFRLGIAAHLIGEALFVFVALALYDLFKTINHRNALCMLTLILVAIPMAFLHQLNAIPALVLVRGSDSLSLFDQPQRDALAMAFLNVHSYGFDVAGIFWGPLAVSAWAPSVPVGLSSPHPGGGADGELLRLSDKQFYVVSTATLRGTRPRMDAPIPLWRTGVHALATDHGCKAKTTGESSVLCNVFVIVLKTGDSARLWSDCRQSGEVA